MRIRNELLAILDKSFSLKAGTVGLAMAVSISLVGCGVISVGSTPGNQAEGAWQGLSTAERK